MKGDIYISLWHETNTLDWELGNLTTRINNLHLGILYRNLFNLLVSTDKLNIVVNEKFFKHILDLLDQKKSYLKYYLLYKIKILKGKIRNNDYKY